MAALATLLPSLIGLGGNIFGGLFGKSTAEKAAEQEAAARRAAAQGVWNAVGSGTANLNNQQQQGYWDVVNGTNSANNTLAEGLNRTGDATQPYRDAGQTGLNLMSQQAQNPLAAFSFNYDDYKNDPAYQFELNSGSQAITNNAAAHGLASSGNVLQELGTFGQGTAAKYYQQAFDRAGTGYGLNLAGRNQQFNEANALAQQGQFGTSQYNAANQNFTNRIADNTTNAAMFNATQGNDVQKFLAQLGLQGATTAGGFTAGAGTSTAAGTLGGGNALAGGILGGMGNISDILNFFLKGRSGTRGGIEYGQPGYQP